MEKLLHERLREIADEKEGELYSSGIIEALCEEFSVCEHNSSYAVDLNNCLKAIADEIEKFYIPRPRFEDGEPCNIGDEVEFSQPAGVKKVLSFIAGEDGITSANVGLSSGPVAIYAGKVKRPKPKVLDADDVEIHAGDTVYIVATGEEFVVEEIEDNKKYPICMMSPDGADHGTYAAPDQLTHREPDSLEKVWDDIAEWRADVAIPGNGWDIKTAEWCDRLTALIERGA